LSPSTSRIHLHAGGKPIVPSQFTNHARLITDYQTDMYSITLAFLIHQLQYQPLSQCSVMTMHWAPMNMPRRSSIRPTSLPLNLAPRTLFLPHCLPLLPADHRSSFPPIPSNAPDASQAVPRIDCAGSSTSLQAGISLWYVHIKSSQ
jgi:hypothetical protein